MHETMLIVSESRTEQIYSRRLLKQKKNDLLCKIFDRCIVTNNFSNFLLHVRNASNNKTNDKLKHIYI